MAEWLTYKLSDFLMYSPRTYHRLVERYNIEMWPLHLPALVLGAAVIGLALRGGTSPRAALATLSACWLWVAWAFLHRRYATINWAGDALAAFFAVEAALLLALACRPARGMRAALRGGVDVAGVALIVFAVVLQPLAGRLAGRAWPQVDVFGLMPDPTVAATLGMLLPMGARGGIALVIPLGWCAVSGAAAWAMGEPDAFLMPLVAALAVGALLLATSSRRSRR